MKKTPLLFVILMLSGSMLFAQNVRVDLDVLNGKRRPNPREMNAMRAEEAQHPKIVNAMRNIENTIQTLNQAPDNFGGNKAQAISDLQQALLSLKKALYFRIYQDRR